MTKRYPENRKAKNPNKDVTIIYETGGRDPEHPFSSDALDELAEESEGSWQVDLRNATDRQAGGYPTPNEDRDSHFKDEQVYPFYYSKKGSPRGKGYPREQDWWQKALSFTKKVGSKYNVINVRSK